MYHRKWVPTAEGIVYFNMYKRKKKNVKMITERGYFLLGIRKKNYREGNRREIEIFFFFTFKHL